MGNPTMAELINQVEELHWCGECGKAFAHEDELNGDICHFCVDKGLPEDTLAEIDKAVLETACLIHLDSLPHVLWADWDISNEEGRREAGMWLARQIEAVNKVLAQ